MNASRSDAAPGSSHRLSSANLRQPFLAAEKPAEHWRIGVEAERFGVERSTGTPLAYEGKLSVLTLFEQLSAEGWQEVRERPGAPVTALTRGDTSITLEPGAQVELSAPPVTSLWQVQSALTSHTQGLKRVSESMNLAWLPMGFHPFATQEELPWVPKLRYPIMRSYLPQQGSGALDMMRRTATVQPNFDFSDERDAMDKLVLSLKLAPLLGTWLANSPLYEGKPSGMYSLRGNVWLHMDPARSGMIERLWSATDPSYDDYIDWALDAGMFLFKRDGQIIANTGQTFRSFLTEGYQGYQAEPEDWQLHLNTLFPDARLKSTLELRFFDSLPDELTVSAVALLTGLLYDAGARQAAHALLAPYSAREVQALRPALLTQGLAMRYGKHTGFELCRELWSLAQGGLRGRPHADPREADLLEPLLELIESEQMPAHRILAAAESAKDRSELIDALRL